MKGLHVMALDKPAMLALSAANCGQLMRLRLPTILQTEVNAEAAK